MKKLTRAQAEEVYDVLVREAQAPDGDWRQSFVMEFTGDQPTSQWRFCGSLGFGGKFRFPRLVVDCYPEHETPENLATITRTNAQLDQLRQRWERAPAA